MNVIRRLSVAAAALAATLLFGASALAYQGSTGASVTTCDSHVAPGGSTCVNATFTTGGNPNVAHQVTFSTDRGGGQACTVSFNPNPGRTDLNGTSQSTAAFGTACHGNVQVCAADDSTGQSACASVIVNNGNGSGNGNGGGSTGSGGNGNHGSGNPGNGNGNSGAGHGNQTQVQGASTGHGNANGTPGGSRAVAAVLGASGAGLLVLLAFGMSLLRRRLGGPHPPAA